MSVWPLPEEHTFGDKVLWLAQDVSPVYLNRGVDAATPDSSHQAHAIIRAAFERMKIVTFQENIVPNKFYPRGSSYEPDITLTTASVIKEVIFEQLKEDPEFDQADERDHEQYELELKLDGTVFIRAAFYKGALNGLTTFSQLFYAHSKDRNYVYTPSAPTLICDRPFFRHGGLSLDIARNRLSPTAVLRVIHAMSLSRLNRLHIHAWDSQSWPIDIPSMPELAAKGAYNNDQIWTTTDVETVQISGFMRGV